MPRKSPKGKKSVKFSKIIIIGVLVSVLAFTVAMTVVYVVTGGIPDTLVASFFTFAGGEAGVLGLIKHSDNKYSGTDSDSEDEDDDADSDDAVG
jgi:flagellar basal body-associated protein FliL